VLTLSKSASRFDNVGAAIAGCNAMRKCNNTPIRDGMLRYICSVRVNMMTPGRIVDDLLSKGCEDDQIDVIDMLQGG
jgi:hypothetical protein